MGLLLSIIITYAGANEAIECLKHIIRGVVPNTQPDFQDVVDYYTRLLRKSANSSHNWIDEPQGYLCLTEDRKGNLHSAIVKYYNAQSNSTALLFSTKISSFGQDSIEDYISNGNYKNGNSMPTKTKTMLYKSSESFSIGHGNKTPNNVAVNVKNNDDTKQKSTLVNETRNHNDEPPEIRFLPYDDDKPGAYNEDFLRSLDGIKYRPLRRNDPSGRRMTFRKRRSSSSSSKESRASREEELNKFTSLEEAEFERMNEVKNSGFGSAPNLSARSHSRSVSRERRKDIWSLEALADSDGEVKENNSGVPKLDSVEEPNQEKEVIEEEDDIDFWGIIGD